MNSVEIEFLHPDARLPSYAHEGDAGADLHSVESVSLQTGERAVVSTGLRLGIPQGYVGLVHPRSGLAAKYGITVANAPGTIDSGYRGEVKVILINLGQEPFTINVGDRIAQIVFQSYMEATFVPFSQDSILSSRGIQGFGSSGGFNGRL